MNGKEKITPELIASVHASIKQSEKEAAIIADAIANGTYIYAKPYVRKPEPTPGYQNTPAYKAKMASLQESIARGKKLVELERAKKIIK